MRFLKKNFYKIIRLKDNKGLQATNAHKFHLKLFLPKIHILKVRSKCMKLNEIKL